MNPIQIGKIDQQQFDCHVEFQISGKLHFSIVVDSVEPLNRNQNFVFNICTSFISGDK